MTRSTCLILIATLIVGPLLAGCVKQGTTMPLPPVVQQNPPPKVLSDATLRIRTLARLSDTYARLCNQLPGRTVGEHRQLMADGFAQLNEILPMLQGPTTDAEFRQQMRSIADDRTELSTGSADLSPEPTIDAGLRALRDLLREIARTSYFDQGDLTQALDRFSNKVDELDTVRGPLHQLVVGEAMGTSSQIVAKMSDILSQRLAEQNATQPGTRPTSRQAAATQR
jgi:hypothetical protein